MSSPQLSPSDVTVLPDPARRWLPATPAQKAALDSEADILLLGGAAGSLKTSTILVDLAMERDFPKMRSYFFRRTYPELKGGDGAIDQSRPLYSNMGGTYNETDHLWKFPSGAELYFRHCQHEKDLYQYQGHAISALGVDESTHWPENFVRYLITRNRSTDPGLAIRVRLGTNPGNVGHKWHMKLFFNGVCPHCEPEMAPPQAKLRWDCRWSDGVPLDDPQTGIKLSVAYILSSVRDHSLLGPAYTARLKMQSPATAKALLEGCWRIFEGQFFDIWEPNRPERPMVVSRRAIGEQWWWPRWVSSDYGFSISIAAAHQFVHQPQSPDWPRGRVYVVSEFGEQETAKTFAQHLVDKWVLDANREAIEYRWMPWYLSPDSFADRGGMFTLAGQMNEILDKYRLHFSPANHDRQGGAMKMYTGLERGELIICEECRETIDAIESRIHDDKHENDVKKVPGDPLDDYYDSGRYGYMSWDTVSQVNKPVQVKIAEQMAKLDPTMAFIKRQQIINEAEKAEAHTQYGGSARRRAQEMAKNRRRLP